MAEQIPTTMSVATEPAETGMLDSVKETLNPSHLAKKFNLNSQKLLEIGLYCGVGFLAGYLIKRYGKFMIVLIIVACLLMLLQQLGIITIIFNNDKFHDFFGIQPSMVPMDKNIFSTYWIWVKSHVGLVLSFSIGFLIGLRVG